MLKSLTLTQKAWVRENRPKYSWRRLAEEFNKEWPGSFEELQGDGYTWCSQEDGMWLCQESFNEGEEW